MGTKSTAKRQEKVLQARLDGMTFRDIRKKFKIGDSTIRKWLSMDKRFKAPEEPPKPERNCRFNDEFRKEIAKRYQNGESINNLCNDVGINRSTIYRWIRSHTEFRQRSGETFTQKEVYNLRQENQLLREENTILHHCNCTPTAKLSIKLSEMEKLKDDFSVHGLCRAMNVRRATFYNHILRSKPQTMIQKEDEELCVHIKEIFIASSERFGANKIKIKLAEQGFIVSPARISRLMKTMDLICKQSRLRCFNSTNRSYKFRKNRVMQNFDQIAPNLVWVSDVTYARVNSDFYAICVIIDLFSSKVVAHSISPQNNTALILKAFKIAYKQRGEPKGLIFHSDQGTQYAAYLFRKYLRDLEVQQSFSNPGTPYDNAVAESFFSIMKREELSHNYYNTEDELTRTVDDYIQFFNSERPHKKLKSMTPDEFEKRYELTQTEVNN